MNEKALVSVIVPVYNTEKYLVRCVKSIVDQSYKNLEIILVDDGSTDNSGDLCDKLAESDDRIKVLHKQNGGLSDARNAGIEMALGSKVCFIDSDDMIDLRYVELMKNACDEYGAEIAQCGFKRFSNENEIRKVIEQSDRVKFCIADSTDVINNMSVSDIIACNKLYDVALFKGIRFPKGRIHEDLATTYKIFDRVKKIIVVDEDLYFYYVNPEGITGSKIKNNRIDLLTIYLEQYDFFKTKGEYKTACERAANNLGASFGTLISYKKTDYKNYCNFKKAITQKYIEMRPRLLNIPMRKDLKLCVRFFPKSVIAFKIVHKIKLFIRRKKR